MSLRDEVPSGVDERRQRHRADDRDAVFQIGHEVGVAAREDDLLDRDGDGVVPWRGLAGFSGTVRAVRVG